MKKTKSKEVKYSPFCISKYYDDNKINADMDKYIQMAYDIKDLFIITKGSNIMMVTNNAKDVLKEFFKGVSHKSNVSYRLSYLEFLQAFTRDTNKFKTYKGKKVWKYKKTLELGNKSELAAFAEVKKQPEVQKYLREKKFERILNEDNKVL